MKHSGICGASELFSCKAAAKSIYSQIFGLPIASLGQAFYCSVLLLLISERQGWLNTRTPTGQHVNASLRQLLWLLFAIASLYSIFLGIMSIWTLGQICPLCVMLYMINFASFGLLTLKGNRLQGIKGQLYHRSTWIFAGLILTNTIGAQAIYAHRYHRAYEVVKQARA